MTSIVCLAAIVGCEETNIVPDDQLIYTLVAVDNKPLPVDVGAAIGISTSVRKGQLLGSPSDDTCEYYVQYQRANEFANIDGPVYNCDVKKGGQLLIRIDVGQLVGPHDFLFQN